MAGKSRFTNEDIKYMLDHCHEMNVYQISKVINRSVPSIRNFFNRRRIDYKKNSNPNLISNRELEVLRLMAKGFSNEDIASQLFISKTTVKTHINNIYLKLQLIGEKPHVMRVRAVLYYLNNKEELEGRI